MSETKVHEAAPAALGVNVLRFAPLGPVQLTQRQREELLRELDAAVEAERARDAARAEAEKMRQMIQSFVEVAEAAVENARRNRGGQHVPYHGDFACMPPSVVSVLARWAKDFRSVLPEEKP